MEKIPIKTSNRSSTKPRKFKGKRQARGASKPRQELERKVCPLDGRTVKRLRIAGDKQWINTNRFQCVICKSIHYERDLVTLTFFKRGMGMK